MDAGEARLEDVRSGRLPGLKAIVLAAYRILELLTRICSRLARGIRSRRGGLPRSTTGCVAMLWDTMVPPRLSQKTTSPSLPRSPTAKVATACALDRRVVSCGLWPARDSVYEKAAEVLDSICMVRRGVLKVGGCNRLLRCSRLRPLLSFLVLGHCARS